MNAGKLASTSGFIHRRYMSYLLRMVPFHDCYFWIASNLHSALNVEICFIPGKRRYDRKQAGFGGQTKPVFHKKVRLRSIPAT
jgi:hypothetical protein